MLQCINFVPFGTLRQTCVVRINTLRSHNYTMQASRFLVFFIVIVVLLGDFTSGYVRCGPFTCKKKRNLLTKGFKKINRNNGANVNVVSDNDVVTFNRRMPLTAAERLEKARNYMQQRWTVDTDEYENN